MKLGVRIVLCILVVIALGSLGAWFTASSVGSWYQTLRKPPGTPPNAVFGPVWTFLYILIGISLARLWHLPASPPRRRALVAFAAQFTLNLSWTPIFFGAHAIAPALLVILTLLVAILIQIRLAWPVDRPAALLLIPYALWVSYASYLNAGFLVLQR